MATLTVVFNTTSDTITQLNGIAKPTKDRETLDSLVNFIEALASGSNHASAFYIVTNNSDPAVATDGGSSTKTNFNNLK